MIDQIDRLIKKHRIKLLSNGKLKLRNVKTISEREKVRKKKKKIVERLTESEK